MKYQVEVGLLFSVETDSSHSAEACVQEVLDDLESILFNSPIVQFDGQNFIHAEEIEQE